MTTIDGRYLPPPPQPFTGNVEPNAEQSTPSWPVLTAPPKGAPNVLLIMIDDEGFGAPSTFGGVIPTPTMDRIAKAGLRYTAFHTTALCSPTRAALLTGRNHHSVSTGVVVDQATHAPHHPTPEWVKKISDMHLFDQGYEAVRAQIYANQKKLGVIPRDAKLTPWPDSIPKWDTLDPEAKKLYLREADVYAAYLAYTDAETGRVVQAVEDAGKLDNTLIIYIAGDNGASPEGTLNGLYSEYAVLNGIHPTVAENMNFYDAWGTDQSYPHYAVGWAWTLDTPYQWTKEVASHFGGTRNGMVMAWPARIKSAGGIRNQFHHVIDVVPTILEAAGLPQPVMVNGVAQKPIEGVSMAYTWDKTATNAPGRRTTQYFEMFSSRAIYHDGWIASAPPVVAPWDLSLKPPAPDVMNSFTWQRYDLGKDWTQADDLAATMPDKLRDMQQTFIMEAAKYNVFPLDDRLLPRYMGPKPSYTPGRTVFTYSGELTDVPFPGSPVHRTC
jgi:arylsulfatase A-like enzyme